MRPAAADRRRSFSDTPKGSCRISHIVWLVDVDPGERFVRVRGEAGGVPVIRSRRSLKLKLYLLSTYLPDDLVIEPPVVEVFLRKLDALVQEMKAAGAWVFTGGLEDARVATVARLKDDEVATTDGPFGDYTWRLGGLVIIKAADLDSATEWGRRLANLSQMAKLPVEVRPFRFDAN